MCCDHHVGKAHNKEFNYCRETCTNLVVKGKKNDDITYKNENEKKALETKYKKENKKNKEQ